MKRLLTYLSIGLVVLRIGVWFANKSLNQGLDRVFEADHYRQSRIDSIKTLRIQLEQDSVDSLDQNKYALLQKLEDEERRLLNISLGDYLEAEAKVENQIKLLVTIASIVDAAMLLAFGALIFYMVRAH